MTVKTWDTNTLNRGQMQFVISEIVEENNEVTYEPLCDINEVAVCLCGQLQGHTLDHLAFSVLVSLGPGIHSEAKRECSRAWIRLCSLCFCIQLMLEPSDNTALIYDSCKQTQPADITAQARVCFVLT